MPLDETSNLADGLEGVVAAETVLSHVDGEAGALILRGHYLQAVAGRHSFEWLTGLLWQDFVPRALNEPTLRRDLGAARVRAFSQMADLLPAAGRLPPLAAVRLLLASVPDDVEDAPLLLTATVAVGLAAALRIRDGQRAVAPDPTSGHAADFLRMLKGKAPSADEAAALDTYLVSAADHGLNASTFAARVAASTRASLTDAVTAALCTLKGPLHGGRTWAGSRYAGCDWAGGKCRGVARQPADVAIEALNDRLHHVAPRILDAIHAMPKAHQPIAPHHRRIVRCKPTLSFTRRCCWRRLDYHAMRSPAHSPSRAWSAGLRIHWSNKPEDG